MLLPLHAVYIAISQGRPLAAVIFSKGHSACALVVKENQVTGVVPLYPQTTDVPVLDDVAYVVNTPSKGIVMAVEQVLPCALQIMVSIKYAGTSIPAYFIDIGFI